MSDAPNDDARGALVELVEGHSDEEITKAAEELGVETMLDQVFDGMQAFMSGKLKLGGDIMLAQTMQTWFAV